MPRLLNPKFSALLCILVISALPALVYIGLILKTNVFGWIVFRLVVAALPSPDLEKACETKILQQLQSPDGAWSAVLQEKGCDFGFGTGSNDTTIRLTSLAHPDQSTELVFYDDYLRDDEHIGLAWSDSHMLRITLPLFSDMKILTQEADGVRVDIKFNPDDPAARAAWLAKLEEFRQAYDAYYHMNEPPSARPAEVAPRADDAEKWRILDQKGKEMDAIKSRAASHNQSAQ